jgi:hypothetical protein
VNLKKQKKSDIIFYIVAAVIALAFIVAAFTGHIHPSN